MTLRDFQSIFARNIALLILYGGAKGYEFTCGDFARLDQQGHKEGSMHYVRLAADLNLFIGGEWIRDAHVAWEDLGEFWEKLHPHNVWGKKYGGDFNHFEMRWA